MAAEYSEIIEDAMRTVYQRKLVTDDEEPGEEEEELITDLDILRDK
jgi:hypothetical protein